MNQRSKASLFLLEQLIVIIVFAVCATACVRVFVVSYTMSEDTRDIGNALITAENGAECYKAFGGDAAKTAEFLGGHLSAEGIFVFYDEEWSICEQEPAYALHMKVRESSASLKLCDIYVLRRSADSELPSEELVSFTVAAGGGVRSE